LGKLFRHSHPPSQGLSSGLFTSALCPLLQSLDIIPTIISLRDAFVMYLLICQPLNDDKPDVFGPAQFFMMIVQICLVYMARYNPKDKSTEQMLLHRIENSPGFRKFSSQYKCSLLVADPRKDQLEFDLPETLVDVDEMEAKVRRI
jgi:hypothetical protein